MNGGRLDGRKSELHARIWFSITGNMILVLNMHPRSSGPSAQQDIHQNQEPAFYCRSRQVCTLGIWSCTHFKLVAVVSTKECSLGPLPFSNLKMITLKHHRLSNIISELYKY